MNSSTLNKMKLPKVYLRNKREHYLDPIRQRLIIVTPEETVRQRIIQYLLTKLKVPCQMIRVEEPLAHYGLKSRLRADIVIEYLDDKDELLKPISIIETKAPNVVLGNHEFEQVANYADMLGCSYISLTNGSEFLHYVYSDNQYIPIIDLPSYKEMLGGIYHPLKYEPYKRCSYKELSTLVAALQEEWTLAPNSQKEKLHPIANLYSCLMDISHKLPVNNYGIFSLIEDYGVRMLTYGNASGYSYSNVYRSFLVEVNGDTQFVSIGINAYSENRTIICVAIDDDKSSHHSLQLAIDTYMDIDNRHCCTFTHTGKISVGHSGSAKSDEMVRYTFERFPSIVTNGNIRLGKLVDDTPWYIDDENMILFITNLISYGIIRDEFRLKRRN